VQRIDLSISEKIFRNRRAQEWISVIYFYFRYDFIFRILQIPDLIANFSGFSLHFSFFIIIDKCRSLLLFTRDATVSKDLRKKQTLLVPLSPSQVFLLAAHKF